MRLAIIADIHGNLPALEAVMAELERRQPDVVIVDGDLINAVPFSGGVVDTIRAQDWLVVRGNHEFYYLNFGTERDVSGSKDADRWGQLHWLVEHLTPEQGRYLAALPDDLSLFFSNTRPLRVAHGVPGHNRRGFVPEQPDEEIVVTLRERVEDDLLITAHTHVQFDRQVRSPASRTKYDTNPHSYHDARANEARRWRIINPGSVGLPLNGDVRAQFVLLDSVSPDAEFGGWRATHVRVPYDRRPALRAYETSGMLAAGGVMSTLFYWELVTAEREIPYFFRWARKHDANPKETAMREAFAAYVAATGRDQYVRQRDPLFNGGEMNVPSPHYG
ncbi:MAG TPA: metallophosphoesterase family protein [Caldilineae bacterium]|nr:metallophosphoesterase family protein [Caldilineae bacterium]